MKKLIVVLLSLCASAFAAPQYTTVTATLIDSSAQVWANASWTTQFAKPSGNNGNFNNGGVPITADQFGVANASGVFTVVLDNNLAVSPSGSGWRFTICPNATVAQCNTIVLTIFGASQDVSSQLNAILTVPSVNSAPIIARAYNDTEVHGSYGALYINSISNTLKQCIQIACEGSGWASFGVSSNNPTFTGTLTVPCVKFNFDLVNDSTLCSQPGTGHINLLLPATGGTLALAGSSSPGAPNNSVQFNTGSGFGGDANFLFNSATKIVQVGTTTPTAASIQAYGSGVSPANISASNPTLLYLEEGHAGGPWGAVFHESSAAANLFGVIYIAANGDFRFQAQGTNTPGMFLSSANNTVDFQTTKFLTTNYQSGSGINLASNSWVNWNLDSNIWRIGVNSLSIGNNTPGDFSGSLKLANATITSLGTSTSPICPNGTGGALTLTGCTTGGTTGFPAQAGTEHFFKFNNSVTIDANNTNPGGLWSHLGGTFGVVSNVVSGSQPPNYRCITSGGTAGLTCSVAEDAVAQQGNFAIFSGFSCYCAIDTGGQQIVWFAMSNQLYGNLANAAPNGTIFGFKYNGNASTHWFAYVSTSNVSLTATDTGIVADTAYHGFEFAKNGAGGIDYYIDNTKVATIGSGATGFPVNTTPVYAVTTTGLLGASIDLKFNFNSIRWWTVF